jgi:hypothetical protein
MRGITRTWLLAVAGVLVASPALAQTELLVGAAGSVQVPVKGRITARDGNLRMIFKAYNQARGGRLIYQEAQTAAVKGGVYFAMIGAKDRAGAIGSQRAVWVEAAANGRAVGERQAFRLVRETDVGTQTTARQAFAGLCFTCGDIWPRFVGAFRSTGDQPTEYGSSCSGTRNGLVVA